MFTALGPDSRSAKQRFLTIGYCFSGQQYTVTVKKHLNLGGRSSRKTNGFKKYLLIGLVSYRNLQEKVRVVTRYMGSGIKGKKWVGIRDHRLGIWDHKPWDRDQ